MPEDRKLRVFLCHSSYDKPAVRELYKRLKAESWIDPWLDEEKLLPGQDWDLEIEKAVEASDAVIVFLSNNSVSKEGYIQRELRFVLRIADFKPEGTVFVIPMRLEDCPMPRRLSMWQYVDYFPEELKEWTYKRLLGSLDVRAGKLGISASNPAEEQARLIEEQKERERKEHEKDIQREIEFRRETEFNLRNENQVLQFQIERAEDEAREKKEVEEQAGNTKEKQEQGAREILREFPSAITKQNLKRYGVAILALVGLIGLIFGGNYIFSNLPAFSSSTPINTQFVTSTPKSSQTTRIPSNTPTPKQSAPTLDLRYHIGSTIISEKDGMTLLYVPAGEFEMGSENGVNGDERPVHTVYLNAFWIDLTEVTNNMYAKCMEAGGCAPPSSIRSRTRESYYGNPEFNEYPVINVRWDDAKTYCEWAGRRLPTEAEWEKAASWDEKNQKKYIYPWGNEADCSLANYYDDGCNWVGDTTEVGDYESGRSPYGPYDMAGNVFEIVADWYDEAYYQISPSKDPFGPEVGRYRVARGGSYGHKLEGITTFFRGIWNPNETGMYVGFRCALSASE